MSSHSFVRFRKTGAEAYLLAAPFDFEQQLESGRGARRITCRGIHSCELAVRHQNLHTSATFRQCVGPEAACNVGHVGTRQRKPDAIDRWVVHLAPSYGAHAARVFAHDCQPRQTERGENDC